MMLWGVIGVLFLVSFLWALWGLKKELTRPREVERVHEELKKEKILFKL